VLARPIQDGTPAAAEPETPQASSARNGLSVFFLSGMLMSFPGAILPAWGYHLDYDFLEVAQYFLALALGLLASVRVGASLFQRREVRFVVVAGSVLACIAFLWLAWSAPPVRYGWRVAGILCIGLSAGMLNSAAFQSISSVYQHDRASTVNLAGMLFGLGCFVTALLISSAFYVYTVPSTLFLVSLVPGFAAGLYARARFGKPVQHANKGPKEIWAEVRSPGAVLFTLLLFFQSGNEWSVAGWLAIFLTHRIGVSPDDALLMLAVYWAALLVGRVTAQAVMSHIGHGKLLFGSALAALLGCLILVATNNRFGAWTGLLLVGGGFASIYPLVVEKVGHRFPDYHPGFYNGLLSFGFAGGLLMPCLLSILAHWWGAWVVMAGPFLGTCLVVLLILLIWIEAKLTAGAAARI